MSSTHLKLHVGCGKRYIPGFVHIDQVAFPHVDHVQDIRDLGNLDDGCADLLYACQVIEYFDREEVPAVLAAWRRVLAPGGVLRLSVPDFEVMTRLYASGLELERFLGTLYGKIDDGHGGHIYHRTTYDIHSLTRVLESAKFDRVERWDWRGTGHRDVDDFSQAYYPHMDKQNGVLWNLNLQARRPLK